jgi:hypothetical protein
MGVEPVLKVLPAPAEQNRDGTDDPDFPSTLVSGARSRKAEDDDPYWDPSTTPPAKVSKPAPEWDEARPPKKVGKPEDYDPDFD